MELQILSRKLIKPSTPTPQHSSSYSLSFFDQISLQIHVPRVYFYSNNGGTTDHKTIINQLEKSLSKTLTRFYPLAGRFSSDGRSVDCLDQGVEFLQGRANYGLAEFLPKFYEDTTLLNHFVPWDIARDPTSVKTPLLAIQVTFFTCGGFALTFLASHVLVDGFSYSTFINQWAATSRLGDLTGEHISPSFILGTIFPPRDVSIRSPPPSKRPSGAKIIMKIFVFNAANISAMKDKCSSRGGVTGGKPPSRVGVVTALVWRTLIRVTQARNGGQLRASRLSLALGLRGGRTHPALSAPDNGFGNIYLLSCINFLGDKHTMELRDLVGLYQDTAQRVLTACGKAQTDDELFSVALDLLNETRDPDLCDGEVDDCFLTSLCRFPLYEADFGWGKPYWISSLNLQREMFTLVDTKCGNGIEARVCLNEVDMLRFESDPYIKAFASEPHWLISPNQIDFLPASN